MDVGRCVNLLGIEWSNDVIDSFGKPRPIPYPTNRPRCAEWSLTIQITLINGTLVGFFGEISMIYLLSQGRKSKICNSVYIQTQYCNAPTSYIVG